ncbi:MAG: acyltransferase [Bacillus sp. (in: firmicutes)]
MKRTITGIANAIVTYIRLELLRFKLGSNIKFEKVQHFAFSTELNIDKGAMIALGNRVYFRRGCALKVREGAKLELGNGVMFNNNCIIGCRDRISIGDGTVFGPGVYIYDHDHDYRNGIYNQMYLKSPIKIGKNCWIGAGTIILRGTTIGDNCVVGAGCVIKGCYPDNQLIVQKRETKVIGQTV